MEFHPSGVHSHQPNSGRWLVAPWTVQPELFDSQLAGYIRVRLLIFLIDENPPTVSALELGAWDQLQSQFWLVLQRNFRAPLLHLFHFALTGSLVGPPA